MSKENKKPKQQKAQKALTEQVTGFDDSQNKPHNAKKEALGPNTKRG